MTSPELTPAELRALRIMQEREGIRAEDLERPTATRLKGAVLCLHDRGLAYFDNVHRTWKADKNAPDLRRAKPKRRRTDA